MDGKKPKRTFKVSKTSRRNPVKKNTSNDWREGTVWSKKTNRSRTRYTKKGKH